LLHDRSFAMRAATTTPVDAAPAHHAHFGAAVGLPRCYGGSASTTTFRGLLSVHSRCGPHGPLASYEAFSRSASAHSLPPGPPLVLPAGARVGRVGISPTDQPCLRGTHNNAQENAIRPFCVGRRNWLFADTVAGAHASANLYSLLQTCAVNGIDGYRYLRALLIALPKAKTVDDYVALLPWRIDLRAPDVLHTPPPASAQGRSSKRAYHLPQRCIDHTTGRRHDARAERRVESEPALHACMDPTPFASLSSTGTVCTHVSGLLMGDIGSRPQPR
jgi:hypothetical protein